MQWTKSKIASLCGLVALAALAWAGAMASADLNITGDWSITGVASYANQTINVTSTNATDGNIIVQPGAELQLENVTVLVAFNRTFDNQGYLELRNSTVTGGNWMLYLRGAADLQNSVLINPSYDQFSGVSGTYIVHNGVSFNNVTWNRTANNNRDWFIHVRVVMDFKGNFVGSRGQLRYELPSISTSAAIEIANNRFVMATTMFTRTNAIAVDNVAHSGVVTYDIHDNSFLYGLSGVALGSSSPTTSYAIHDSTFFGMGVSAIEVGFGAATSRFVGEVAIWNVSVTNATRVARLWGDTSSIVVGTLDNITVFNCANGVFANEATWIIRNSTFASTDPQYTAEINGHIFVYDTLDVGFLATAPGAGGSVEHYQFFNLTSMAWQNGTPLSGDVVSFRDSASVVTLTADPNTWTPREIVWWGVYAGNVRLDRRDLRPVIVDGPASFSCAPAQFYVSPRMPGVDVVCTDDMAPILEATTPSGATTQNRTVIQASGNMFEWGAGLTSFDWSLDNASWSPVTLAGDGSSWTLSTAPLLDGTYPIYLRAVDRVGLVTYERAGPVTIDTVVPMITIPAAPPYASGTMLVLAGTTEANVSVSFLSTGGLSGTVSADASGAFSLDLPLVEGLNVFFVTSRDAGGNSFTVQFSVVVDNVAPWLGVSLASWGATRNPKVRVAGLTEISAVVTVGGVIAPRSADTFSLDVTLVRGLNLITVNATDTAGNLAQWFGVWWYGEEAPALEATINTGNQTADGVPVTRSAAVPVTGSAVDASSAVSVFAINGINYSLDGTGEFFVSFPVIEGDNTLVIAATDVVGNTASLTLHVIRDSTAPTSVATLLAGDANLTVIAGQPYTHASTAVVSLVVSEDGVATVGSQTRLVTVGANLFTVPLAEGTNSITISIRDRAGNPGAPVALTVVRDTTAPSLALSSPTAGAVINDTSATVEGFTEPGATVTVNGIQVPVTAAGAFSTRVTLRDGTTTIVVTSADSMGNSRSTSLEVSRATALAAPTQVAYSPDFLMLTVGVGAGLAVGLVLRSRRGGKPAQRPAPPPELATAPPTQDAATPKGPRGPQRPGD